jgi:hypothetical protein
MLPLCITYIYTHLFIYRDALHCIGTAYGIVSDLDYVFLILLPIRHPLSWIENPASCILCLGSCTATPTFSRANVTTLGI